MTELGLSEGSVVVNKLTPHFPLKCELLAGIGGSPSESRPLIVAPLT